MKIYGIDPGPSQSADVLWDTRANRILDQWQGDNNVFLVRLKMAIRETCIDTVVIEDVTFYGKVLNKETFGTLKMIGRMQEICEPHCALVEFPNVAYHFCNSRRGVKQSQINAVLTARFGGKGTKNAPGVLFGVKEHCWSALAMAVYWMDIHQIGKEK